MRWLFLLLCCGLAITRAVAAPVGGMAFTWPTPSTGLPAGCTPGGNCLQDTRTGKVYLGLTTDYSGKGQDGQTLATAGTPWQNAVLDPATQPGDTIDIYPSTYTESDVNVTISMTFTCIGTWPSMSGPGQCVRDSSASYRPGTKATAGCCGYLAGNGLVTYGELRVGGDSESNPTVVVNGVQFQNATNRANPHTTVDNCFGASVQPGAPEQCGATAIGGVRIQSGTFTCNGCGFFHDANGLITTPFIYGTNSSTCNGCFLQYDGGGDGQEHGWYCGRGYLCNILNSILLDTLNGNGFKNRGYTAQADGNVIGDSDACGGIYASTWVPQLSSIGGSPQQQQIVKPATTADKGWGVANGFNSPDGGTFSASNDVLCKSHIYSSNTAEAENGGVVEAWPNAVWTSANITYLTTQTGTTGQYIWNAAGGALTDTNLAVTGNAPGFGILGLGTLASPTLNGTSWSGGSNARYPLNWTPIEQTVGTATPIDCRTVGSCPSPITSAPASGVILGGPDRLAVNLSVGGIQVTAGAGGADASTTSGGILFTDAPGDTASNVTMAQEPSLAFFNADGDTLTVTGVGGSFVGASGRNLTLNLCNGGTLEVGTSVSSISCGSLELKATNGYVPSGVINLDASDTVFCDDGCNLFLQGNEDFAETNFMASPIPGVAPGPATIMMDLTAWTAKGGVLSASEHVEYNGTGCSYESGYNGITDFANATCQNFFFLIDYAQGHSAQNSTYDMGPSTGASISIGNNAINGAAVHPAIVAGSGSGTVSLGLSPTLIEVLPTSQTGIHGGYVGDIMPAHLSGGSLTITNYNSGEAANTPIMLLGGLTVTGCTASGGNATVTISDGSKLYLDGISTCGAINYTAPSGWNDGSLSGAAASGTHGTTISVPITLMDAQAQAYPGEMYVSACAANGSLEFNGKTGSAGGCVTAAGRFQDLAPALASLQETLGAAGSDTLTIDAWNAGAQHLSASVPVTVH